MTQPVSSGYIPPVQHQKANSDDKALVQEGRAASGTQREIASAIDAVASLTLNGNTPLDSVTTLVTKYNQYWDEYEEDFQNLPVDLTKFRKRILAYTEQFRSSLNLDNAYGFIEKRDFRHPIRIGVHADIHGDLKGLLELLKTFQECGLLDEKYKCLQDVQIVFLGDYVDRGDYSTQVLELLLAFHMENPDQVVLIRGNHENYFMNCSHPLMKKYGGERDEAFHKFVDDKTNKQLLQNLYATMPLSLYIGQKDKAGHRQYVHFTHGLFELCADPSTMLDDQNEKVQMVVSKERQLSDRVRAIKFDDSTDYLGQLSNTTDKAMRKSLKLQFAAREITKLCRQEGPRDLLTTTYNWGDISDDLNVSFVERPNDREGWKLSVISILCYLRLSGNQNPVKMILRGHQHKHRLYSVNGKAIVITLPVSRDNRNFQSPEPSVAYILKTAPKVKDWRKIILSRAFCSSSTEREGPYCIRQLE